MSQSPTFPRSYLLEIYNAAVRHGSLDITPISQADAKSLQQKLYRLRRRSDSSTAQFIIPEFHLVTVGTWHPANNGTLPIYYSHKELDLPSIVPTADEQGLPLTPTSTFPMQLAPEEDNLPDLSIADYVDNLLRDAAKKAD